MVTITFLKKVECKKNLDVRFGQDCTHPAYLDWFALHLKFSTVIYNLKIELAWNFLDIM